MNKERLKLIVKNLDSLITDLNSEIYSDDYIQPKETAERLIDYDEIFEDDEFQDWGIK